MKPLQPDICMNTNLNLLYCIHWLERLWSLFIIPYTGNLLYYTHPGPHQHHTVELFAQCLFPIHCGASCTLFFHSVDRCTLSLGDVSLLLTHTFTCFSTLNTLIDGEPLHSSYSTFGAPFDQWCGSYNTISWYISVKVHKSSPFGKIATIYSQKS